MQSNDIRDEESGKFRGISSLRAGNKMDHLDYLVNEYED
jgi:hypothetical protein